MSINTWYHLAVVRNSSGIETLFLNGVRSTTGAVTDSKNYNGPSSTIGYWAAGTYFPGNLASIRAVVGTSLYDPTQSSITVPSYPLTSVPNTKLLLLAQSSSTLLTDTSGIQTITNNNGSTWNSAAPATAVGCPTTVTKNITVNALPTPTFTAQPGATACPNVDVTYTTQSGQTNYVWTIPGTAGTNYTITSGGTTADETVTLKWLTLGNKIVTVN